jgi:nucleotidyltransferase substrate binding protein (TIGR01987 family)
MEVLELRHESVINSLKSLKEALDVSVDPKYKEIYKHLRCSIIQNFETCLDTFWKFLKLYLETKHQTKFEFIPPAQIIRQAFETNLIQEQEYNLLVKSIADRNLSTHTYNEETAEKITKHIPLYYDTMKTIIDRIKI